MNTYQEPRTDCLVGQSVLAYLGMAHLCTCIEMVYIRRIQASSVEHQPVCMCACVCDHI